MSDFANRNTELFLCQTKIELFDLIAGSFFQAKLMDILIRLPHRYLDIAGRQIVNRRPNRPVLGNALQEGHGLDRLHPNSSDLFFIFEE